MFSKFIIYVYMYKINSCTKNSLDRYIWILQPTGSYVFFNWFYVIDQLTRQIQPNPSHVLHEVMSQPPVGRNVHLHFPHKYN